MPSICTSRPPTLKQVEERVFRWVDAVLTGKIIVGKLVRQAIERDERDKNRTDAKLRFSKHRAWKAVAYFSFLRHWKGSYANKPLELEPWELWATWVLFGWERQNDNGRWVRRFTRAYCEIARKNGKSTWAAGIADYLFTQDDEEGAEVYSAATTRDQAAIVWQAGRAMLLKSPELSDSVTFRRHTLHYEPTLSIFEPLSSEADSLDGLNIHAAIVDELHAHPGREVWDVLDTGTGAREQPLIFGITTAGCSEDTICYELRKYATSCIDGTVEDDQWFCLVFTVDDGDDPLRDEKCWGKANPNLGISVNVDDLRQKCRQALEIPAKRNDTLRKHFNIWTNSETLAIPMEQWNACSDRADADDLAGETCYGGLDFSLSDDLTAFVLVFPPSGSCDQYRVLPWFWLPAETIDQMGQQDKLMHQRWVKDGFLEQCDGKTVDYELVRHRIVQCTQKYDVRDIGFDPWNANETATILAGQGIQMVQFGQLARNMNEPTKKLLELVREGKLAHGGHPILKWNASNLQTKEDKNGNLQPIKPTTKRSVQTRRRIDGVVATIMALGRSLATKLCDYPLAV